MWTCFNDAFVSAVQDYNDPNRLCIRSRKREHLQRLFPHAEIIEVPNSDYACRIFVSKTEFAEVVTRRVEKIDYPNFKNSVRDRGLHDLYASFWHLHYRYQSRKDLL